MVGPAWKSSLESPGLVLCFRWCVSVATHCSHLCQALHKLNFKTTLGRKQSLLQPNATAVCTQAWLPWLEVVLSLWRNGTH